MVNDQGTEGRGGKGSSQGQDHETEEGVGCWGAAHNAIGSKRVGAVLGDEAGK